MLRFLLDLGIILETMDGLSLEFKNFETLKEMLRQSGQGITVTLDRKEFKEMLKKVPRVSGQRILWARSLNLDSLLACRLKVGDFLEELLGFGV